MKYPDAADDEPQSRTFTMLRMTWWGLRKYSLVSRFINADLLILLSDIDGLYTADPRKDANAELIEMVDEINDDILSLASGKGSELGTGGMITKLNAAKICMDCSCTMVIANGSVPENLYDIIDGKKVGTKFCPKK